jgi:hypothetical protein
MAHRLMIHGGELLSHSTLWRAFGGKAVSRRTLEAILRALNASESEAEQCHRAWEVAHARVAERRVGDHKPVRMPLSPNDASPGTITIHGGDAYIGDGSVTSGKRLIIYAGTVTLSAEAAATASQIEVHGGNVSIVAYRSEATGSTACGACGALVQDKTAHEAWHNATRSPTHLRRVQ